MIERRFSLLLAMWVNTVHGRNETVIHGWVAEPQGRGTWSIIWSCLVTIILCTWSVLHLDVPSEHGTWHLLARKLYGTVIGAIAPEALLCFAVNEYVISRRTLRWIDNQIPARWTQSQVRFAIHGGLQLRNDTVPQGTLCQPDQLIALVEYHVLDTLPVSHEELLSRSQTDSFTKLLALSQVVCFLTTTIARAILHLDITLFELLIVATVVCSIFSYGLYFRAPQNVEFPITINLPDDELSNSIISGNFEISTSSAKILNKDTNNRLGMPVLTVFGCILGGIHCLAWNWNFVTSQERLAWCVSSVTIAIIPIANMMCSVFGGKYPWVYRTGYWFLRIRMTVYAIARITTIILALMALRAVPESAFETVYWNHYFPHFAA